MKINPLPPNPKIRLDSESVGLISEIDRKLGQLDGCCILDSGGVYQDLLSIREALFSLCLDYPTYSPINLDSYYLGLPELTDGFERYKKSLSLGQKLLKDVASVEHIIKSIHKELVSNTIGGGYRKNLVWINDSIKPHNVSKYVAPEPDEITSLMKDLENYLAKDISYPAVINAALIHAQFEMIHPFESHNGLVGRILIHLYLLWKKKLSSPLLQISKTLNKHKLEYFDRLEDIEKNENWSGWIKFFLHVINEAASDTLILFKEINQIWDKDFNLLLEKEFASTASIGLLKYISRNPAFTISQVTDKLGYTKQTMNLLIKKFEEENIIIEVSGKKRYRTYSYKTIYDLLIQDK